MRNTEKTALVSLDALLKKDPMASLSAKTYELTK
jgi:hypothetical protein